MSFRVNFKKIPYKSHSYANTGVISGLEVAAILNQNPNQVFKTLVTSGSSKTNYVSTDFGKVFSKFYFIYY